MTPKLSQIFIDTLSMLSITSLLYFLAALRSSMSNKFVSPGNSSLISFDAFVNTFVFYKFLVFVHHYLPKVAQMLVRIWFRATVPFL